MKYILILMPINKYLTPFAVVIFLLAVCIYHTLRYYQSHKLYGHLPCFFLCCSGGNRHLLFQGELELEHVQDFD